jgi:hypothetical protein
MKEALVFVATGRSTTSQPRQAVAKPQARPSQPESRPSEPQPAPPADDAEPSVWVDRVKTAPNIYISRPDKKR